MSGRHRWAASIPLEILTSIFCLTVVNAACGFGARPNPDLHDPSCSALTQRSPRNQPLAQPIRDDRTWLDEEMTRCEPPLGPKANRISGVALRHIQIFTPLIGRHHVLALKECGND